MSSSTDSGDFTMLRRSKRWRKVKAGENLLHKLPLFCVYQKKRLKFRIECCHVSNLSEDVISWAMDLTSKNMKHLYERSEWGWSDADKRKEMTHKEAWYLVAYDSSSHPQAFTHFRFDQEQGFHVLYCYEIQLEERVQGCGLGRHLMTTMENIADQYCMEKVMLTVFKHNNGALHFFTSVGYKVDDISPSKFAGDDSQCTYEIMSKPCGLDT